MASDLRSMRMEIRLVDRHAGSGRLIDLAGVADLLGAIGAREVDRFARALLAAANRLVPVAQCTVFAYESGTRPRTLSLANRRGARELLDISSEYARLYYALDGNQRVMLAPPKGRRGDQVVVLHRQRRDEIAHAGYRMVCYDQVQVCDRASVLTQSGGTWLSVNFYRGTDQRAFRDAELDWLERFAPVAARAAVLHHAQIAARDDLPALLTQRLFERHPQMTKRERDVVHAVLAGRDSAGIADALGLSPASVNTYVKRACRRLGVSGRRELVTLCLSGRD